MARVKRQGPAQRRRELAPGERAALMGEEYPDPAEQFFLTDMQLQAAWDFSGPALTAEWVGANPGSRPPGWWRFEAPQLAVDAGMEAPNWRPSAAPEPSEQRSILARLGALTETEGE